MKKRYLELESYNQNTNNDVAISITVIKEEVTRITVIKETTMREDEKLVMKIIAKRKVVKRISVLMMIN